MGAERLLRGAGLHDRCFELRMDTRPAGLNCGPHRGVFAMRRRLIGRLLRDDRGGEILEYALILGLIVVTAIAVIGAFGTKVLARWTSVNSSI